MRPAMPTRDVSFGPWACPDDMAAPPGAGVRWRHGCANRDCGRLAFNPGAAVRAAALAVACFCFPMAGSTTGLAQDAEAVQQLRRLHAEVAQPRKVLSIEEGRQALGRLHGLNLRRDALEPEAQAQIVRIKVYSALALGDARLATGYLVELREQFPDQRETLDAGYLTACTSGDAQLGEQMLKQLRRVAGADERPLLAQRRRWLRGVGTRAPEITITTEEGTTVAPAERDGAVLVIDFWATRFPPSDELIAAFRQLHELYGSDRKVEFLGVNTDSSARLEQAQAFAKSSGYAWSQHYERGATGDESVHTAFGAGTPPWQIVVDQYGYIRAVGAADELGFQYALRAAVAEAKRRYDPVLPRTRAGQQAAPEKAVAETTRRQAPDEKKRAVSGELPSNPEAAQKLRLARTFLKAGRRTDAKRLFEEVVRDYPGTREAKLAQEYLDNWP
jgi:thiol-disulfide isomerase/thioredoxin